MWPVINERARGVVGRREDKDSTEQREDQGGTDDHNGAEHRKHRCLHLGLRAGRRRPGARRRPPPKCMAGLDRPLSQRLAVQDGEPGWAPWARAVPAPRPLAARPSSRARASVVVLMAVLLGASAERMAEPVARRSPGWGASDAAMLARARKRLMCCV